VNLSAALVLLALAVLLLAYSNGANDNFKGVATLFGSGTARYGAALAWATVTTLAGCLLALVLAQGLVEAFSGKGLVPDAVAADPTFLLAVSLGAALTVLLATRLGLPVSTTHVSVGALFGIGAVSGTARWRTVLTILLAWGTTLPLGAALAGAAYAVLSALGGGA
jgi:PiT family inorganic phosphate transporter